MYTIDELCRSAQESQAGIDGRYVPARPIAFSGFGRRLRDAWFVLTGKADAVIWYKQ